MKVIVRPIIFAVFASIYFGSLSPAEANQEPFPVLVLVERNPWLMVIGSDSPSFALYESGKVIFRVSDGYLHVQLKKEEYDRLIDKLKPIERTDGLRNHYNLSNVTDQITQIFFVQRRNEQKLISVYGTLRRREAPKDSSKIAKMREEALGHPREKAPRTLVSLFDEIKSFSHPNAEQWLPEKIEVMIWPYEYAPDKSIIWPAGWPDIEDSETVKRGDSYSIFLPSKHYPELIEFLETRRPKGAVEINGKKWAVSYRFPFPAEHNWMAP